MSSNKQTRYSRRLMGLNPSTIEEDYYMDNLTKCVKYYLPKNSKFIVYKKNGEIYRGQMKNDMRHGKGQMIYENGVVYDGLWEYDEPKHVNVNVFDNLFLLLVHEWYKQNGIHII